MVSAMALSPVPEKPKGRLAVLIGASAATALVATVAAWEGKSNVPYRDVVGILTVCYGETHQPMRRYTDAECKAMLEDRLADYAGPVLERNPELRGHDAQLVAASSLAYNIGVGNYRKSSVARLFSAGRWREACDAFLKWNRAGGREVRGLTNRRKAERAICLKGL
jgi:lysozyme